MTWLDAMKKYAPVILGLIGFVIVTALAIFERDFRYTFFIGSFFYIAQIVSQLQLDDASPFILRVTNDLIVKAILLSHAVVVVCVIGFISTRWDELDNLPLYQDVPLRMIWALQLLWLVIIPGNTTTSGTTILATCTLFIFVAAAWIIAAASFDNGSPWLWWPALHALTVDVGIYCVLLVRV